MPSNNGFQLQPAAESVPVTDDFRISFPRLPKNTAFRMSVVVGDVAGGVDGASVDAQVRGGGGQGRGSLQVQ